MRPLTGRGKVERLTQLLNRVNGFCAVLERDKSRLKTQAEAERLLHTILLLRQCEQELKFWLNTAGGRVGLNSGVIDPVKGGEKKIKVRGYVGNELLTPAQFKGWIECKIAGRVLQKKLLKLLVMGFRGKTRVLLKNGEEATVDYGGCE